MRPDGRGAVLADVGDPARRELVVADEARQEQHDDRADDAGDVRVVRGIEPVDLRDALAATGAAQVAHCLHRVVEGRHRRATLATPPFRSSRNRAVRVGAPPRPRRDEEPRRVEGRRARSASTSTHADTPEPQYATTEASASTPDRREPLPELIAANGSAPCRDRTVRPRAGSSRRGCGRRGCRRARSRPGSARPHGRRAP